MRIQTFFVVLVLALAYTRSSKSYHYRVLQRRAFNFGLESAKQIEQPLKNVIGVHSSVISAEELRGSNPLRTGSSIVHPEINYVQDSQNFKIPSQLPSESHPSQQAHNQFLPKHVEDIDFTIEDGRSKNLAQFKTGSDSVKKSGKNLADKENVRKIYKTKSAFISYARKIMQKLSNKMKNLKIKFQNYIRRMTLFFKGSKAKAPHPPISRQPSSLESISSLGSDVALKSALADEVKVFGDFLSFPAPELDHIASPAKISEIFEERWKSEIDLVTREKFKDLNIGRTVADLLGTARDISKTFKPMKEETIEWMKWVNKLELNLRQGLQSSMQKTIEQVTHQKIQEALKSNSFFQKPLYEAKIIDELNSLSKEQVDVLASGVTQDSFVANIKKLEFSEDDIKLFIQQHASKEVKNLEKEYSAKLGPLLRSNSQESQIAVDKLFNTLTPEILQKRLLTEFRDIESLKTGFTEFKIDQVKKSWFMKLRISKFDEIDKTVMSLKDPVLKEAAVLNHVKELLQKSEGAAAELVNEAFNINKSPKQIMNEMLGVTKIQEDRLIKNIDIAVMNYKKQIKTNDIKMLSSAKDLDDYGDKVMSLKLKDMELRNKLLEAPFDLNEIKQTQAFLSQLQEGGILTRAKHYMLNRALKDSVYEYNSLIARFKTLENEFGDKVIAHFEPLVQRFNPKDQNSMIKSKAVLSTSLKNELTAGLNPHLVESDYSKAIDYLKKPLKRQNLMDDLDNYYSRQIFYKAFPNFEKYGKDEITLLAKYPKSNFGINNFPGLKDRLLKTMGLKDRNMYFPKSDDLKLKYPNYYDNSILEGFDPRFYTFESSPLRPNDPRLKNTPFEMLDSNLLNKINSHASYMNLKSKSILDSFNRLEKLEDKQQSQIFFLHEKGLDEPFITVLGSIKKNEGLKKAGSIQ